MWKAIVGVLMILSGLVLGLYVGVWVCFIGGIVDVINQVKATEVAALPLALGIAKIFFASFLGWLSFFVLLIPGIGFISVSDR